MNIPVAPVLRQSTPLAEAAEEEQAVVASNVQTRQTTWPTSLCLRDTSATVVDRGVRSNSMSPLPLRSSANSSVVLSGHWIQACPTNEDKEFDNKPRFKRTTGIPRSFLKTVEAPAGTEGASGGVMITPEGGFVVAEPDMYVLSF